MQNYVYTINNGNISDFFLFALRDELVNTRFGNCFIYKS